MTRHRPASRIHTYGLLKGGAILGVAGAALADGGAAEARSQAQKDQIEALKAAAATRAAVSQPAAQQTGDYYSRAKVLLGAGDVTGAMAAFRRVLANEPQSVDAMNGLAVTYDRMGRHDVARGWYEAALAVAPDDAAVLTNLGYSLTLQGEWRDAIPFLQAAIASNDPAAEGIARRLLSRVDAALTAERAGASVMERPAEVALYFDVPEPVALAAAPVTVNTVETAELALPAVMSVDPEASSSARIEIAANGEARLVMGSPRAPTPEMVASLGDAAALVLAVQPNGASKILADAGLASIEIDVVMANEPIVVAMAMPPLGEHAKVILAPLPDPHVATIAETIELAEARPAPPARSGNADPGLPEFVSALQLVVVPEALSGQMIPALPHVPASHPQGDRLQDEAPGWLLHVRREGFAAIRPTMAMAETTALDIRLFDCDDRDLNSFAARLRHIPEPLAPLRDSPIERQMAIARLEAVIMRARQA